MEKYILCMILSIGGLALLFCGLYCDPEGEINPTLLVAFGESLTFCGAVLGIDFHYNSKHNEKQD